MHIGRVEIRLDWSLLITVALVTVGLGSGLLPRWRPEDVDELEVTVDGLRRRDGARYVRQSLKACLGAIEQDRVPVSGFELQKLTA